MCASHCVWHLHITFAESNTQLTHESDHDASTFTGLNGTVKQELAKPDGGEFNFAEANDYYKQ